MIKRKAILILLIVAILATFAACSGGGTVIAPVASVKPSKTAEPGSGDTESTEYPELNSEAQAKIKKILKKYGATIDGIYNYINNDDADYYIFYEDSDKMDDILPYNELCEYILEKRHGVCYHYASLTYYLLTEAGYEALIIHGYRNCDNALHYWTMVKVDGEWYHFDPLHHQKLLTDSDKHGEVATRGNGMTWESGIWPTTK